MSRPVIYIGTSGFYNKAWVGIFYPEGMPGKEWFSFYCKHFNTFEINATFYKFPTLRIMQNWYDRAPEGFMYAVKAPKVITHLKRFGNCETEIAQFYSVCREGLAEKLGPVLFQLPPSFSYSEERLNMILEALSPDFNNVVEFRNSSWWREDVYSALAAKGITFCSVSYPGLPEDIIANTSTGYVRLHGSEKLFYSQYSPEYISALADKITIQSGLSKAFVFFNNTASTAGIISANQFKETVL
jgi:uncharacterized protein YecE (DUF72 family)